MLQHAYQPSALLLQIRHSFYRLLESLHLLLQGTDLRLLLVDVGLTDGIGLGLLNVFLQLRDGLLAVALELVVLVRLFLGIILHNKIHHLVSFSKRSQKKMTPNSSTETKNYPGKRPQTVC